MTGAVTCWNFPTKRRCAAWSSSLAEGGYLSSSMSRTNPNSSRLTAGFLRCARATACCTERAVVRVDVVGGNIGAVHREAGDHFLQRIAQTVEGKIPRAAVLLRQAVELVGQHVHFAGKRHLHDQALGVVDHLGKGARVLRPVTVETGEGLSVLGRDKQAVEHVQKVIAARAIDRPVLPQCLPHAQNLFHHNVEWSAQCRWHSLAGLCQRRLTQGLAVLRSERLVCRVGLKKPLCHAQHIVLLEALEVLLRVVQPVRMVNAHAVDLAFPQEAQRCARGWPQTPPPFPCSARPGH